MSVATHFLPGLPKSNHWSKFIQMQTNQGLVWINLALKGDDANSVGREIASFLTQSQVTDVKAFYQLLLQLKNIALDNQVSLSLTAAVQESNQWTFFAFHGLIGLKRKKRFRWIISERTGNFTARSGYLLDDDIVFLGSDTFFSHNNRFNQLVQRLSLTTMILEIKQLIQTTVSPASTALLLLNLQP